MITITLFHSYNYINCKYTINDNYIYNKNNNLLFNIINVPKDTDLYKLRVTNILSKKKFSQKLNKNNDHFYTKHNLKFFIEINYKILYNLVCNSKNIPSNNLLFKLLKSNYVKNIHYNKKLIDTVCINWGFKPKLKKMEKTYLIKLNNNTIQFYNLEFNYTKNTITKIHKNNQNYKNWKGGIFLCDLKTKSFDEISKYLTLCKNTLTLIIVDTNNDYILWNNLKFYYSLNIDILLFNDIPISSPINKIYNRIIAYSNDSSHIKIIKNLNNQNNQIVWVVITKLNTIKLYELVEYYNIIYDMNLDKHNISEDIIVSIIKSICYRNYILDMTNTKHLIINSINSININSINHYKPLDLWNFCLLSKKECNMIHTNTKCSICYYPFNGDTLCKFNCGHYFCIECVKELIKLDNLNNLNCPICRQNVNTIIKLEQNLTNLLNLNNIYHFHQHLIQLINIVNKPMKSKEPTNLIIVEPKIYNFIKNIFNFQKIKSDIHQYNQHQCYININNNKQMNIILIGNKQGFDISLILDSVITKKNNKIGINYIEF